MAAAGTPEEASAVRWLRVQGSAVKCIGDLVIGEEEEDGAPGADLDARRLSALLVGLPALTSLDWLTLRVDLHRRPTAAAARACLAGVARAIGHYCTGLQTLRLHIALLDRRAGQLPKALLCELASMRSLEDVALSLEGPPDQPDWPPVPSLACLVARLAGPSRLRALFLAANGVAMDATLPASTSRLARLTSLVLGGFQGLRCAPGWARLPALECLRFIECEFAADGGAALPGMAALRALTSMELRDCRGLHVLPASLWRLTQLRSLDHWNEWSALDGSQIYALPVVGLRALLCVADELGPGGA